MDDADYASLREEQERAYQQAAVCAQLAGWGTLQCVECGEDIDAARRRALPNANTCVHCQRARELSRKRFRVGGRVVEVPA